MLTAVFIALFVLYQSVVLANSEKYVGCVFIDPAGKSLVGYNYINAIIIFMP